TVEQTFVHHWFLWQDDDVVELDQLLRNLDVDPSLYDEWEITDISRDGTAIIGNTRKQGVGMGWRAYIDGLER
ncbi:MAG TPA: hypothetical protein VGK73_32545, partial [Polyangiaceae bacterium]